MSATLFDKARAAACLLGEIASEVDGDALDLEGAKTLVDLFTRCERLAVAGRGVAARRVETGIRWKHAEHRNSAEWLASATGVSVGEASRELETAKRLEDLPATAEAYRAGELSGSQAAEIAATATLDPDAEARLLETVRDGRSFRAVRNQCRETAIHASDDAARARHLHETRSTRMYPGLEGHSVLHAEFSPDIGARVNSVLEKKTDELFRTARSAGTTEPRSAYAADALGALILGETQAPSPDVRLHVDAATLERGYAVPGERCHVDGIGPIPVALAKTMLQDAKVTQLRHDDTGDITQVSSPTRMIPAPLRRWVQETYPTCGRRACESDFRLEIDHIIPLAEGGRTEKQNLWHLCGHDHYLKHHRGWHVVELPDGTCDLVPPDGHPPRDAPTPWRHAPRALSSEGSGHSPLGHGPGPPSG